MSDMNTNTREFTRKFPSFRRAALSGKPVVVRDREGNEFVFERRKAGAKTLADAIAHLAGVGATGVVKKSLRGYGTR